jgi:hypothetical protein
MWGTYYGTVQAGNTGPNSGHNSITESVVTFTSATGISEGSIPRFNAFPNPATENVLIEVPPGFVDNMELLLVDRFGKQVMQYANVQPATTFALDLADLEAGVYFIRLSKNESSITRKLVVTK